MALLATIDNTMGAMFIGVLVAGILYGAACIQAWYYYMHQKDRWPLRFLVGAVMICDTIHQAFIAHTVYSYLVTNFGNQPNLGNTVWSLLAEVLVNGFTTVLVQSFLAYRVWQLSNGNIWISAPALLLVAAEFICVFIFSVIGLSRVHTFAELAELLTGLSITVNVLAAAGDTYIAGLLTLLLHSSRTGFSRSNSIINKLIIFAVNTGALTSLCAIASMLSILLAPNTFIYISFFFCMGRLYANSLLATLNVRTILRKNGGSGAQSSAETGSIPLGSYNNSVFVSATSVSGVQGFMTSLQQPQSQGAISVKIDTRREFVTDPEQKHPDSLRSQMDLS
ncbi:hypothetical protein GYMLUDRAFT_431980 [Collybiopsis luxurians FD-317 M1]|uniref:DUF6534 domain-containing protein n=1 Tax=Collybiopsis luxurians FD-317 M1 TaxID=944289 RepID=A0A0D0CM31_9AGAR|nr:hypothetical protein GYMLUDRAFT_431980 [Collybiopsis luxurians FD-317 M1]